MACTSSWFSRTGGYLRTHRRHQESIYHSIVACQAVPLGESRNCESTEISKAFDADQPLNSTAVIYSSPSADVPQPSARVPPDPDPDPDPTPVEVTAEIGHFHICSPQADACSVGGFPTITIGTYADKRAAGTQRCTQLPQRGHSCRDRNLTTQLFSSLCLLRSWLISGQLSLHGLADVHLSHNHCHQEGGYSDVYLVERAHLAFRWKLRTPQFRSKQAAAFCPLHLPQCGTAKGTRMQH
jgi:hypothetical protein